MTKQELFELLAECLAECSDDQDIDTDINELLIARHEARQALIEEIEERQYKSGFYAQQDLIDMYRRER